MALQSGDVWEGPRRCHRGGWPRAAGKPGIRPAAGTATELWSPGTLQERTQEDLP